MCDLEGPLTRWEGRETGTLHAAHCTGHWALSKVVLGWGRALERGRSAAQRWKELSTVDVDVVGRRLEGLWAVLVRTAIAGQERLGWLGWGTADRTLPAGIGTIQYARVWRRPRTEATASGRAATRGQRTVGAGLVVCARVLSSNDEGVCAEMRFPAIG